MTAWDREALRAQLVSARIAGDVATPREANLRSYRRLADGSSYQRFGLVLHRRWTVPAILEAMARLVGVSPDPAHTNGPDTIDPDLTLDALDAAAKLLGDAARDRVRVMLATGHPSGLLPVHLALASGLRAAGCTVLTPVPGWRYEEYKNDDLVMREIRYIGDVAMVSNRGELNHTHSAVPMQGALAALTEAGEPLPDLVVADHGWAGAAGQAGATVIGFADSNDPGLFLGQEEGKVDVVVPLDDNVSPHMYGPLIEYLRHAAGR
jgi:Phosphatase